MRGLEEGGSACRSRAGGLSGGRGRDTTWPGSSGLCGMFLERSEGWVGVGMAASGREGGRLGGREGGRLGGREGGWASGRASGQGDGWTSHSLLLSALRRTQNHTYIQTARWLGNGLLVTTRMYITDSVLFLQRIKHSALHYNSSGAKWQWRKS